MKKLTLVLVIISFLTVGNVFAKAGQFHYVKPLQAQVYEEASEKSRVQFIIAIGRKVVEFKRKKGFVWCGVDKAGGEIFGWIKLSDLAPTDPDGIAY